MRLLRTVLLSGLCVGLPALACAQAAAPGAEPGVMREDCQVAPSDDQGQDTPPASSDLSGKLDACNGVLQPPPTGDAEIREPAPDMGKTPVIPPGAVPEQAPNGEAPSNPPG